MSAAGLTETKKTRFGLGIGNAAADPVAAGTDDGKKSGRTVLRGCYRRTGTGKSGASRFAGRLGILERLFFGVFARKTSFGPR